MKKLILFLCISVVLFAQSGHTVTLTWEDTQNPAGTTYSVYRADAPCSGTPTYIKLAEALTVFTYDDTGVQSGNYCYMTTATFNNLESTQSNTVHVIVPNFPPVNLAVTVQ